MMMMMMDPTEVSSLIKECSSKLSSVKVTLGRATAIAQQQKIDTSAWTTFSIESSVTGRQINNSNNKIVAPVALTGGYSNTDHIISLTGDEMTDRLDELKRKYVNRLRAMQLDTRGSKNRWNKPKVAGERRRRIVRDADAPEAPPEPPVSGYTIFVTQLTTKIRHDRPNEPHNQPRVVQEISSYWKSMTDNERSDYNIFAEIARKEYKQQIKEFRATGSFRPSEYCEKKPGSSLWVRKRMQNKNNLERELETYETYTFPLRPPELDEAYKQREAESKEKRKRKLQQERLKQQRRRWKDVDAPGGTARRPQRQRVEQKSYRYVDNDDGDENYDDDDEEEDEDDCDNDTASSLNAQEVIVETYLPADLQPAEEYTNDEDDDLEPLITAEV